MAALFAHYIRPVPLGPLARPRPRALATYCASVVGELALIAVGFRALSAQGPGELRPDAMAVVAGIAMLVMITLYALGRFVRPSAESPVA